MNTVNKKKITSLRLDKNLYSHLQEQAKKESRSINNFLEKLIKEALNFNEPNEETIQAIQEARKEKEAGTLKIVNPKDIWKNIS